MRCNKITAIIRTDRLEETERELRNINVKGVSVSRVKGFGEYANFFDPNWLSSHARLEIFCCEADVERIANTIMEAAHTGSPGDGILAVLPIERVYRIRTRSPAHDDEV